MLDVVVKSYWRGALDFLVDIEIKTSDEPLDHNELHAHHKDIRVCVCDDEVVGFYIVNVQATLGRIKRFAVKPSWHRQGVGTAMMDDLLMEAWTLENLSCTVGEYELPAQLFLQKCYFRAGKVLHDDDGKQHYLFTRRTAAVAGEV